MQICCLLSNQVLRIMLLKQLNTKILICLLFLLNWLTIITIMNCLDSLLATRYPNSLMGYIFHL